MIQETKEYMEFYLNIMNSSDIMVANNEFTISTRGTPLNKTYTFRADPKRLNIYKEMGVNLVSLANNHIYDYGIEAFNDTLKYLNIITPGATETTPGVFRCYDNTLLKETIKEVKEKSDYVVLLIHWGKEDSHELEEVIKVTGKEYIDEGADLIVGSHAHLTYKFIPCKQEDYKTSLLYNTEKERVLNNMNTYSINTILSSDGTITELTK